MCRAVGGLVRLSLLWELLCLFAVAISIIAILNPFSQPRPHDESGWTVLQLTDVVAQLRQGRFPIYVGQSDAVPDGTPYARAPAYPIVGAILSSLTFGRATPTSIHWVITICCVIGGISGMYFGLGGVLREYRFVRLLIGTIYVIVTALLWQVGFGGDTAFMAVPLIPLLFCSLLRRLSNPDGWAQSGTASILALLWMTHPQTGMGATFLTLAALVGWIVRRGSRTVLPVLTTALLFGLLSVGYFTSARTLGVLDVEWRWTEECALPVAMLCQLGAFGLRFLLLADRWEVSFQFVWSSGTVTDLGRTRRNAACVVVGLSSLLLVSSIGFVELRQWMKPVVPEPGAIAERPLTLVPRPIPSRLSQAELVRDPVLRNHILQLDDSGLHPIVRNENAVPIRNDRPDRMVPQPEIAPLGYVAVHRQKVPPFAYCDVEPNQRSILTLIYWTKNYCGEIRVDGDTIHQVVRLPEDSGGMQSVRLLILNESPERERLEMALVGGPTSTAAGSGAGSAATGLNVYQPELLPVHVCTLSPYTAHVTAGGGGKYLETHRRFVSGYRAKVNGEQVRTFRSPDGMVLVPLQPGPNWVQLDYRGTTAMRVAGLVSAVSWLGMVLVAVYTNRRKVREARAVERGPLASVPAEAKPLAA